METPTSDFGSNGSFEPSEPSTPATPIEPFQPKYKVKVTDPIKDGENLLYTVKTVQLAEKTGELKVVREYEDFEWLHHCLIIRSDAGGLIIPPLPPKPLLEPKSVANQSKKQLGKTSQTLIGDEFHKDCRGLEKYLRLLVAHCTLGKDVNLEKFLMGKDPPIKAKIKKGLFGKLTSTVDEARKRNHRDIDEYFQKERDWANHYAALIKELSQNFNKLTYSEQRIDVAYGHLSTALNLCTSSQRDETTKHINQLLVKFSEALDDAKHGAEVDVANDENSLGFQLDLCQRYADALKEMHFRRTCLLVDYEDANRALDKAKPQKRSAAEDTKVAAEKSFDAASDLARREIQVFNHERVLIMQEGLTMYADAKVKTARDTYALLAKSLAAFKQMDF